MNLSFFIPWITTGRGGTEHVGSVMANAMAQKGHAVTIHTFDNNSGPSLWPLHDAIRLRCHKKRLSSFRVTQILMELASERPDLIVGLGMNRNMLNYVAFGHRIGAPVMLSEHMNPATTQKIGVFSEREREVTFSGTAGVHLLLQEYADGLPDYLQDRLHVVPNIVSAAAKLADPVGPAGGRPTLLTVARLNSRKNIATLVRAFSRSTEMKDWILRIVGDGPERGKLEALARDLKVQKRVEFTGTLEESYPEYERAQAFVLPSLEEGFPMVILEAMAHGLPTIGFRSCSGVNDQIKHETTGILCDGPDDVTSLAAALDRIGADPELRASLGRNGHQDFLTSNDPDRYADALEVMFSKAAATGNGPPDGCNDQVAAELHMAIEQCFGGASTKREEALA